MASTNTGKLTRTISVALIGNPNTGKSTLFNALAGKRTRVGNFPGVTVDKKIGHAAWGGQSVALIDLPGTYSLSPRSLDERISVDVLLAGCDDMHKPDVIVCVADAANLERNFYLFSQALDLEIPCVLVLNMADIARRRGITVNADQLAERLGVAIVVTEAHHHVGIDEVRLAILDAAARPRAKRPRTFPDEFYRRCGLLTEALARHNGSPPPAYLVERLIIDVGGQIEADFAARYPALIPGALVEARTALAHLDCELPLAETRLRYAWARDVLAGAVVQPAHENTTHSDRLDRILTHWVGGLVIFLAVMFVVFQTIYTGAEPFMNAIGAAQGWLASQVTSILPPGALRSLIIDGTIAGVGGVVVFLPQIVMLFFFIGILEDCGYTARAAFLMDRLMTRLGLSGKSFIPLMSSFACAVPGIMATRVIENRRDRMTTILVAPLMSCSARLQVYLLLIGTFIPATSYLAGWVTLHALVLFGISSLGALVAIPIAWVLKKTLFRGPAPPFVIELPSYKWPSLRVVAHRVYDQAKAFLTQAGTLIFATSMIVWALGYFPGDHSELDRVTADMEALEIPSADVDHSPISQRDDARARLATRRNELAGALIANSCLGRMGHAIEPAVKPLGWDWRIGVGAIAAFPAREVIVATLGTIYSLGGDVDSEDPALGDSLRAATWPDGSPVYNVPVALSIMVFFALCAQCAATLMVIKRETNSWRWPIFTFVYMTALAYLGAFITYQVGMMLT